MLRASRRQWLQAASLGLLGSSASGWFPAFADSIASDPKRRRHCILLWMTGGPTQTDTFDMKPSHANGGQFKEVATKVPGLRFSEHLPKLGEILIKSFPPGRKSCDCPPTKWWALRSRRAPASARSLSSFIHYPGGVPCPTKHMQQW